MKHEVTHMPFRSWCSPCRIGKGKEDAHKKQSKIKALDSRPVIQFDYCVWDEQVGEDHLTQLSIIDMETGALSTNYVLKKGVSDKYTLAVALKHLEDLG